MQNKVKILIPIKCLLYITRQRILRTSVYSTPVTLDTYNLINTRDHRPRPPFNLHQLNHHSQKKLNGAPV